MALALPVPDHSVVAVVPLHPVELAVVVGVQLHPLLQDQIVGDVGVGVLKLK